LNWIWRLLWLFVRERAKRDIVNTARRRGTLAYLRAVQGTRRGLMALLLSFVVLHVMILGFIGSLVTGLWLWNADFEFKVQILFGVFLGLWTLPAILLFVLFSERLWYRVSGAEKMMRDL